MSLWSLTLVIAGIAALGVYYTSSASRKRTRDVDGLPRPPRESWLFGNLLQLFLPRNYGDHEFGWHAEYGDVYVIHGVLGQSRMMVADPMALNHLLRNDDVHLAPMMLALARSLLGRGNAMALRGQPLRNVAESALTACTTQITKALDSEDGQEGSVVNIAEPLSTATLSAISQVILGLSVEALGAEVVEANVSILLSGFRAPCLAEAMAPYLPAPFLDWMFGLPLPMFATIRRAYELGRKVGDQVIQELAQAEHSEDSDERNCEHLYGKILAQNSKKALSPDELAMQTNLVLIAGQDTTANTLAFALAGLARQPALQEALRAEIRKAQSEPEIDDESLPLLNAVIKVRAHFQRSINSRSVLQETLRLLPAEPIAEKIALVDLTMPLSRPVTLSDGRVVNQLFVPKGQLVGLAFAGYQRGETRWGPEPEAFNPYRWIEGKVGVDAPMATSPYAHLLAFSNGPHVCLGWRFAILEMQVILTELIPNFVCKIPEDPALAMGFKFSNTLAPCDGKGDKRAWLLVERVRDL
ncbi:unnamed protein product [Mycena citricolor]|uniref:Cytochrome P450 n=1 Tax=Mycena citricolor TaxID=2018698 RepID=A0AAD2H2N5_9AGAR|nr:unnamed protein product [Mycena citricolor]